MLPEVSSKMLQYIKRNPDSTIEELADYSRVSKRVVGVYIRELREEGKIVVKKVKQKHYYSTSDCPIIKKKRTRKFTLEEVLAGEM